MGNGSSAAPLGVSQWQLECHSEHEGSVNCMALSEDNSVLATGSDDGTIRLWTTSTGRSQCLGVLSGHKKYITCLSLDGGSVISGSADKTVKKWDISTGECVFTYEGHTGMVNRMISTGDFIFTSSYDGTARCWVLDADPSLGYDPCVRIFRGHTKGVYPLVFIPAADDDDDDNTEEMDVLITGSGDGTARSWSVETGKCVAKFSGHCGPVHSLSVDSQGEILFTGSTDGTIRSWNIETAEVIKVFEGHTQPITAMIVSNKFLYSGSADRTASSWVVEFGDQARVFKGHKHSVSCLIYHDGHLYTGSGDGMIRVYESKSGTLKRTFKGHNYTVNCMKIVNERLFTGSFDQTLRIWSLKDIDELEGSKPKRQKESN